MIIKHYSSHEEIPVSVRDYILTVSSAESIDDVSLKDINSFLFNLESHLKGDLKSD